MRYSPTTILHFLANHHSKLKSLVDSCQKSRVIGPDQLYDFQLQELTTKLVDYKILHKLSGGNYRFEEKYFTFLSFLIGHFRLELPARLSKYQTSLSELFAKLQTSKNEEERGDVVQNLVDEIGDFTAHLQQQTTTLEHKVDNLRNAQAKQVDYTEQIREANYLIEHFLRPLNLILDKHEDAIIQIIRRIQKYAHSQIHEALDRQEEQAYTLLHSNFSIAEDEVMQHIITLVRHLLPLLEEIKAGNMVLQGLKRLRDYYAQGKEDHYDFLLPPLHDKNYKESPLKYDFELAAENVVAEYAPPKPVIVRSTTQMPSIWIFNESYYQSKIMAQLPIDNFFLWCQEALEAEKENPVERHKLFKLASLLFKNEWQTTFRPGRTTLQLSDAILEVPHIQIKNS